MDKTAPPVETHDPSIEDRIRIAAHQIWEEEGKPDGASETHWFRACEMIAEEDATSSPAWLKRDTEIPVKTEKSDLSNALSDIKRRLEGRAAA
jgi:Protein of unknown function (DUF2934)